MNHKPSATNYRTGDCRCRDCKLLFNEQVSKAAVKRRKNYTYDPGHDHGTTRTYQRGCKCRPCIEAQRLVGVAYRKSDPARQGVCESCGDSGTVVWDHDHATGVFRGWLCRPCNLGLGHFTDDPEFLLRAAEYLEGENA